MKTWVEISKLAFEHNIIMLKDIIGPQVKFLAVVKGNAYGSDINSTVSSTSAFVDWYGVDTLDEANKVRDLCDNKILIMGYADPKDAKEIVDKRYSVLAYTKDQAYAFSRCATPQNNAKIHLKVDSGLVRLGLFPDDTIEYARLIMGLPNIEIEGLYTHFAKLFDEKATPIYKEQLTNFDYVVERLKSLSIRPKILHAASSFAAIMFNDVRFQLVRVGILMHGLCARDGDLLMIKDRIPHLQLIPTLSWKTTIINIKDIPAGKGIGYSYSDVSTRVSKIAIIGVGFYDGIDRRYNKYGEVLIRNKKACILGKIGMNMCAVDVTEINNVSIGDEVIIIGRSGGEEITAYNIASKLNTSTYEVLARINPSIPRILI